MKGLTFAAVIGIGLVALVETDAQGQGKKKVQAKGWHTSYESGRTEARRTGKPLHTA